MTWQSPTHEGNSSFGKWGLATFLFKKVPVPFFQKSFLKKEGFSKLISYIVNIGNICHKQLPNKHLSF